MHSHAPVPPVPLPPPAGPPPFRPERVGPYRILGVLGEGGMGTVYLAAQEHPRREVALKVIRRDLAGPHLLRRFEREAEVLGRLQHPGIAQVYEAGTADTPNGPQPYIAMERVRGVPLGEHPRARGPVRGRVELVLQLCDAVQYAHQRGVIHRDLKPANVLVDEGGRARVLDFGIARLSEGDPGRSTATGVGEVLGSLAYMSPEQVTGDPLDVDVRSDVYALGVILYELLAGRRPLRVEGQTFPSAVRAILEQEPTPLGRVDRVLAGDLETIVATALAKEKDRRYRSAAALADDLRRHLADEPITARPASAAYQIRKFARRNRALVAGAALAAGALVVGAAASAWQAVRATAAERVATAERARAVAARAQAEARGREALAAGALADERRVAADSARRGAERERAAADLARAAAEASAATARREAAKAQAVNAFLGEMLAAGDPEHARGRQVTVRDVVDRAARRVAEGSLAGQPEVEAAVRSSLGNTYLGVGDLDSARVQLERSYALHRAALGPAHPLVGRDAFHLGNVFVKKGDYDGAVRRYEEAIAVGRRRADSTPDEVLVSYVSQLAYARYAQNRNAEAERLNREAVRLARRGGSRATLGLALRGLGELLAYTSRPVEGAAVLREAVAVLRAAHGPLHPDVALAEMNFAYALAQTDAHADLLESIAVGRTAHAHVGALYPEGATMRADAAVRLGAALMKVDSLAAAEPLLREAIELRARALGDAHVDVAFARDQLGRLAERRGRFAEAETLYTKAYAARRAALGDRHPGTGASMQVLGRLAFARGDTAAGVPLLLGSAERWAGAGLARYAAIDRVWAAAGAFALGRLALADSLARAIVARDTAGGVQALTLARAQAVVGRVAQARGDSAGAEAAWVAAHARAAALPPADGGQDAARIAGRLAALCERRACATDAATWRARAGSR